MVEEEENETENENENNKDSGGMLKIILLVNAVLILIGIAVGVTIFVMSGDEEKKQAQVDTEVLEQDVAEAPAEASRAPRSGGQPIYVPLNPAFVVNFENQELVSFLQVDIQIMTYDTAVEQALRVHMPVVRNELLLLLGGKQYHEINTREGKRKLSQEAIKEIRRVLDEAGAPSGIEALYFTSFVMQ